MQDTAGEEKYASLSAFYCRGASVAILAFDLTRATTFKKLQEIFIPLLQDSVDNCLTVVVGTKVDLLDNDPDKRQVRSSEGVELAVQQHDFQLQRALKHTPNTYLKGIEGSKLYYETSAKSGKGVERLFEDIQCMVLEQLDKSGASPSKQKAHGKGGGAGKVIDLGADSAGGGNPNSGCCK